MLIIIIVFFFGVGCSEKWKEEVQLSDDRIIVVERERLSEGGGGEWAHNRSGTKPKEYRIRFIHPDKPGEMIEWRSTKISPGTYPEKPLILDLESGNPIVYAIVAINGVCEVYSKYIYRNGAWVEEALPEKFKQRTTNLFLRVGANMQKYVALETKRKVNADLGYRQSIRQVGPNRKVCSP